MLEPTQSRKDDIARIIATTLYGPVYATFPDDTGETRSVKLNCLSVVDALAAGGYLLPAGLTAQKLREIADVLMRWYSDGIPPRPETTSHPGDEHFIVDIEASASALDTSTAVAPSTLYDPSERYAHEEGP